MTERNLYARPVKFFPKFWHGSFIGQDLTEFDPRVTQKTGPEPAY